jgi:hypothetical protein
VTPPTAATPPHAPPRPPLLETGDHLTRDEFERRYSAMPHLKKAELIEGIVYLFPRVRWREHALPHADLVGCLGYYRAYTPGVRVADNVTVRLDLHNEPQPDVALLIEPARGGQVRLSSDGQVEGGPELVAEVAASSVSIDLHTKLRVYLRSKVREYVVWRVQDQAIDWLVLRQGQYDRLTADPSGIYRSEVFPGLWLDAGALARGDMATVLQVLQQGAASPEHAVFVAKMQAGQLTSEPRT